MNTSQPQNSLEKKRKKVETENEAGRGLDCYPSHLPAPGKLSIRPPRSKNCSAVPVRATI